MCTISAKNGSKTENSGIKTSTLAREHVSTQGKLACEYVSTQDTWALSTQDTLACQHISTQGTLAFEHVFSTQGTQFSRVNSFTFI